MSQLHSLLFAPPPNNFFSSSAGSYGRSFPFTLNPGIRLSQAFGGNPSTQLPVANMGQHSIPVLSTDEVINKFKANVQNTAYHDHYGAMYSSILGGITTDPAMMLIPIDDHMVHRGHGVFDTASIFKGHLYELDLHLDRLLKSASMAKITPPFSRQELKEILMRTVAASNLRDGSLRYWLSAGPGGFSLSSGECVCSSFYAMVLAPKPKSAKPIKVITSSVPMKAPLFATMKNVNYLPNALSLLEAEERGAFAGIWVDEGGFVAEGPNMNVAFVSHSGELMMPPFDKILSGCTAKRTLAIAHHELLTQSGPLDGRLKGVVVRPVSIEEGKNAAEMMLIGSGLPLVPVVQWDDRQIGDGKPGPITLALKALLEEDMQNGPLAYREPVPYAPEM